MSAKKVRSQTATSSRPVHTNVVLNGIATSTAWLNGQPEADDDDVNVSWGNGQKLAKADSASPCRMCRFTSGMCGSLPECPKPV